MCARVCDLVWSCDEVYTCVHVDACARVCTFVHGVYVIYSCDCVPVCMWANGRTCLCECVCVCVCKQCTVVIADAAGFGGAAGRHSVVRIEEYVSDKRTSKVLLECFLHRFVLCTSVCVCVCV